MASRSIITAPRGDLGGTTDVAVVDATRASFCDTGESGGDDVGGVLHDECSSTVVSHMILRLAARQPGPPVRRYFCVARAGWSFQFFWWYSLRLAHRNTSHFHHLELRFQVRFSASQSHISPSRCSLACSLLKMVFPGVFRNPGVPVCGKGLNRIENGKQGYILDRVSNARLLV
jgi:hypothetical protein